MAELKTKPSGTDVIAYLNTLEDETKRTDSFTLLGWFKEFTGSEPVLWGDSMIGFGSYSYKQKGGQCGEWFKIGFAPRKANLVIYLGVNGVEYYPDLLAQLGKHKQGKGCLYITRLSAINQDVLKQLLKQAAGVK